MPNQDLVAFIKSHLLQNASKEQIYKDLLSQNWTIDDIQSGFNVASGKSSPTSSNASTPTVVSASNTSVNETEEKRENAQKRTTRVILTIGALLVGAGIFSFIAANWNMMSRPLKMTVIIVAMLVSYGLGWYLKQKVNSPKTAETLFLLGSVIYGSGIFLVAQMFNIRANWPDGFLLWMIGCLAMGFAIESYPLFTLSAVLGIVAIIGHPFGIFSSFGLNPFMMTSSLLLLVSTAITFATGWIIYKRIPPELRENY